MADIKQVISKLNERTEEKRIPWRQTFLPDSFQVSIGNQLVTISKNGRGDTSTISLSISGSLGESIASAVYDSADPGSNGELFSLFEGAKRYVTAPDARLDELMDALDTVPLVSQ